MRSGGSARRRVAAGMALALLGGSMAVGAGAARVSADGAADGPPDIAYTTGQLSRMAGGTPVRISGSGFLGTTSVKFGNAAAAFKVVDSNLITAVTPSAAAAGASHAGCHPDSNYGQPAGICADITITDNEGSTTGIIAGGRDSDTRGMFYTNGTLSISPDSGMAPDSSFGVTISGYAPHAYAVLVEMNPLIGFLEGGPDFPRGPPPYIHPHGFLFTDDNGDLKVARDGVVKTGSGYCWGGINGACSLDPYFTPEYTNPDYSFDVNASCPVTQETADFGLSQCMVGYGQFAVGTLEHHFAFRGNPAPAPPTVALSQSAARNGDTVALSGMRWNANPYFGSDTTPDDPGETQLSVAICNSNGTNCTPVPAHATADLTRYKAEILPDSVYQQHRMHGLFSGATLSGSFTVASTSGCAPNCLVRVRQQGFDYDDYQGQATPHFVSATAPLTVG